MTLELRPITLRAAQAFVGAHHRHNDPPRGHKFSVGLYAGDHLVGIASAGRPVARGLDDGVTIEVNRTCCVDLPRLANGHVQAANSRLYGAVWRAARAMGYRRGVTYTLAHESGSSLLGAGWVLVEELPPRSASGWLTQAGRASDVELWGEAPAAAVARRRWEIRAT